MTQPRVFMPDQKTPAQDGTSWQAGDVFAVQHGPNPTNLFFYEHTPSRSLNDGSTRFAAEVRAYVGRVVERQRQRMVETVWLVAEAYGADRACPGCQKVVRKLDERELGYSCIRHFRPQPNPTEQS